MSKNSSIPSIYLDDLNITQLQQEFDFGKNTMHETISAGSIDTITLGSGYNYPSITGIDTNYVYTNGTSAPYISITDNTSGWNTISVDPNLQGKMLKVNGDAEFEGELIIKGVSLTERLDKIEERLAILRPNEQLEEKWDALRELGEQYRNLEKEIIEKQKIWEILKK